MYASSLKHQSLLDIKISMSTLLKLLTFLILIIIVGILLILYMQSNQTSKPQQKSVTRVTATPDTPSPSPSITPPLVPIRSERYPVHKHIFATMFWVGEKASDANEYIPNMASAWDSQWLEHFGGIDNPYSRNGYYPNLFTPKENPFYIALPYNDLNDLGRKENSFQIPWYSSRIPEEHSLVKNRWVKLMNGQTICYAQWEDVGPFETDDFAYVFQGSQPTNKRAGIDLSPAARECLRMVTNGYIDWQFVDEENVPDGPWKKIITTSQTNW